MTILNLKNKNLKVYSAETIPTLIVDSVSLDTSTKGKLNVSVFINKAYCKHIIEELSSISNVYVSERRHRTITTFIKKSTGDEVLDSPLLCFTKVLESLGFNVDKISTHLKNDIEEDLTITDVCYNYITFTNIND